jgi:predicted phage tail protein
MNSGNHFSGAGGGSAKQQTPASPVNTMDNLRSNDRVEVMLGLCHGPIKGLVNGFKSFKVGEVALEASDGSRNFLGADLTIYQGWTPGDTIRPSLGGYEDFRGVWQSLVPATALSITTQTSAASVIVLRFRVDKLWRRAISTVNQFASDGLTTHAARFEILWKEASAGSFTDPFNGAGYTVFGKTDVGEIHEVRLTAPTGWSGPFVIEITQTTPNYDDAPCVVAVEGYYEVMQGQYGLTRSQNIGVELSTGVSVVRTTQSPPQRADNSYGIDMMDVRLVVNQLYENRAPSGGDPGGVFEDEIELTIELKQTASGTWINPFGGTVKIRGKTQGSPVVFEYRLPVVASDTTWDVRITRISGDLGDRVRSVSWESLQEIVGGPARFDGVAVARFNARASNQFSSIPEFSGTYDLMMCNVPVNYDPATRTYTGPWNGTFKLEWTDNPAWCLYDFAMNDVYGARQFWPELSLDRYSVYDVGRWCDEMVPNGRDGSQPRFTFNEVISEGRGIREQLRFMAGSFNSVLVDELNGQMRLVADRDADAVAIFTPENVTDGTFEYSYSDIATRYNDITIRFKNANIDYERDSRKVSDPDHQALFGVIPFEFAAVGCTDAHEAVRRGAYRLITATSEVETVSFQTNRRGLLVKPFDTILVADPDMGRSLTGRMNFLSANRIEVNLRDPLYLETDVSYQLMVDVPDPSTPSGVISRAFPLVGYYSGFTQLLVLADPLPLEVPALAPFSLGLAGSLAGAPKPYRVLRVEESNGSPDSIQIEAIEINRNKWLFSDLAVMRGGQITVNLGSAIGAPAKLNVVTTVKLVNGEAKPMGTVTWEPSGDPRVNLYRVQYRASGDPTWTDVALTRGTRAEVFSIPNGTYDFRVGATFGAETAWTELLAVQAGLSVPPSDVARVDLAAVDDMMRVSWPPIPDLDFSHYVVKHAAQNVSATWSTAQIIVGRVTSTSVTVPLLAGTYMVKAVDTSGMESNIAAATVSAWAGVGRNTVETISSAPTWPATKVGCVVDTGVLKSTVGVGALSTYTILSTDLGRVYLCRVSLALLGGGERAGIFMDDWTSLSALPSMSSAPEGSYNFLVDIQSYDGAAWSAWASYSNGDYIGQQFRLRVTLQTFQADVIPALTKCDLTIDMPDRFESKRNEAALSTGKRIDYARAFHAVPTLSITQKNAVTGDYTVITNESVTGFDILFKNAAGTDVARTFDWLASGYGYGDI